MKVRSDAITEWLIASQQYESYQRGDVDKSLHDEVEGRCPNYGDLSHFFHVDELQLGASGCILELKDVEPQLHEVTLWC